MFACYRRENQRPIWRLDFIRRQRPHLQLRDREEYPALEVLLACLSFAKVAFECFTIAPQLLNQGCSCHLPLGSRFGPINSGSELAAGTSIASIQRLTLGLGLMLQLGSRGLCQRCYQIV